MGQNGRRTASFIPHRGSHLEKARTHAFVNVWSFGFGVSGRMKDERAHPAGVLMMGRYLHHPLSPGPHLKAASSGEYPTELGASSFDRGVSRALIHTVFKLHQHKTPIFKSDKLDK